MSNLFENINKFAAVFSSVGIDLRFTMMEIGGVPLGGEEEPFHRLLDIFPGSRVIAFELDKAVCDDLNKVSRSGLEFFPIALGRSEEIRKLYETTHPMCCSLYEPNENLIRLYQNFEVAYLKNISEVETISLDKFSVDKNVGSVDFIKIDIQGAELDVFQGGLRTLSGVVAIVSEVEFIPHYIDQPLFGDVCSFLTAQGIMFHKFLGMAGRALRPIVINNNPVLPSQHIWSDAVFIRDVQKIDSLEPEKLLKMGVLAYLYGSPDVTYYCFNQYDIKAGSDFKSLILSAGKS